MYPSIDEIKEMYKKGKLTRREFLLYSTVLGLSAGAAAAFLVACGGASPTATTAPAASTPASGSATPAVAATRPPAATPAATTAASGSGEPRVLKFASLSNITTWDPRVSFSSEAMYMSQFYEPLIWINPTGSKEQFKPALAESWEHSDDAKTWTFHLRKGVKFHDGGDLTADLVIKNIESTLKLGMGASYLWNVVDKMEAPDPLTVVFTLKYASDLQLIAGSTYGAWIMSPKTVEAAGNDSTYFEAGGIEGGSGAYKVESYTPDKEIVLTKFDDYWGGWSDVPHFDKVVISIVPEAISHQQMLEGGQVDLANSVPLENVKQFEGSPNFTVVAEPSTVTFMGYLNTKRPPLDNKLVRQAISYGINYDDVLNASVFGYGVNSRGPVPHGLWPYSDEVFQYTHDVAKAKDLLKQAGLEGQTINLVMTYSAENQNEARIAPIVKDNLSEIGVEVEIKPMLWNQQWQWAKDDPTKAQDILVIRMWPSYSDGLDDLKSNFGSEKQVGFNLGYWYNTDFDNLISQAASLEVTDREKSQQLYIQAMNMVMDEGPSLFFFDAQFVTVLPNYIKGFQYNINYPTTYFLYPLYKEA